MENGGKIKKRGSRLHSSQLGEQARHAARETADKKNGGQGCKSLLLTFFGIKPGFCPNPLPADR